MTAIFPRREAQVNTSDRGLLADGTTVDRTLTPRYSFTTGTSNVAGLTFPSFHAGNDSLTFALPAEAPSGARTGP
jgi:hypothetical protein